MKRLFTIALLTLLCSSVYSQWSPMQGYLLSDPYQTFIGNLDFDLGSDNGLYVTGQYAPAASPIPENYWVGVNRSHNNGTTWIDVTPIGVGMSNFDIICIDSQKIALVYGSVFTGVIQITTDDGLNWDQVAYGADGYFFKGDFIQPDRGLVLYENYTQSNYAELFRLVDGVSEFIDMDSLIINKGYIQLVNDAKAFLLCRDTIGDPLANPLNNMILKTEDFGATWTLLYKDADYNLNHIWFDSEMDGVAVGSNGRIMHTTDGGDTWIPEESGTLKNINFVTSMNGTYMCVGDGGLILNKEFNDDQWLDGTFGTKNYKKVKIDSNYIAYLLTSDNQMLKSTGALNVNEPNTVLSVEMFPNPCHTDLHFNVSSQPELRQIVIHDLRGMEVMKTQYVQDGTLDVSSLAPGLFFITFEFIDQVITKKIIKI